MAGIRGKAGKRGEFLLYFCGGAEGSNGGLNDGVEIDLGGMNLQLLAEKREALDEILDMGDAFGNIAQSILPEIGIIPVMREVLQGEIAVELLVFPLRLLGTSMFHLVRWRELMT